MDVVLVGLPGAGKTAVGRRVAARHNALFLDLDERLRRVLQDRETNAVEPGRIRSHVVG